ncbi:MAG: family 78 glycoside hydrolase catalytic domain [Candidatus Omnitrophica bacterium]|nr:family 78 glycoside hydrolase catalytic domain [Candidatus Omnitrophota bacterium]
MKSFFSLKLAGFILLAVSACAQSSHLAIQSLRCEYRRNPLGIDTLQPRLSWILESDQRGQRQSAYRVLVASTPGKLSLDQADLWDSGKVESDQSVQVLYGGKPLRSLSYAYWKVRAWDEDGHASSWSEPGFWSMGILQPADWKGDWIAATDKVALAEGANAMGYHATEAENALEVKWAQVDLGHSRTIDRIILSPPTPPGFEQVQGFGFPVRFRLEVSDDPAFNDSKTILDQTGSDYPNPGNHSRSFDAHGAQGRYVRVTATKLWDRHSGAAPFCFALGEMEVVSGGEDVALKAPVKAKDSVEASGWSINKLTDGAKLAGKEATQPSGPGNAAVLLRKEINLDKSVKRAIATFCGLGYSELYINGRKIGDHVLDPGFTDFSKRDLYLTYDVSDFLRRGQNAIGVVLGGGWYNLATPDLFGFERAPWTTPPKLLFQLALEYSDGSTGTVVSDRSWKWATGSITFNCVRGGETIDARLARPGWDTAGYDDSDWQPAMVVKAPSGKLVSEQHPPIRARSIAPVKLTEPKPGVYVFDLGVNISGWARFKARGRAGQKITLQYNELLNPDGTVNTANLTSHTHGRFQTEEYILKGQGEEVFEPRFTYHGFQYVQVTGLTQKPSLDSLTGRWVTTDPAPAGHFSCSNPRINKIQELIIRTQLNNMHGIPTDCPQREKMGWMNDGCVCMEEAFYNLDTPLFYTKWFHDMLDDQDPNGHVPDFVPTCGWGRTKADGAPGDMADPWWGGAIVMAPWKLYQYYGDIRVLEEGYRGMKAYVDYLTSTAKDHIINWGLGDWLDESAGGGGRRVPVSQTSTAAYYYQAKIVSQTAGLLGKTEDEKKFAALADTIRATYNARFLKLETGLYAPDSQTAQALPLCFGLVPEPQKGLALARLVDSITGPRQGHISAGIVGTLYLFKALMENGRDDLAYTMMTQESFPGWLNMINHGATTVWEAWNGGGSRNHPTLGCAGVWYYQGLAGIRPDPAAPGFKKIIIRPAIVGDLTWVKADYDSVHGRIESAWRKDGGVLTLNVSIPVNTTATVYIPAGSEAAVTEGGGPANNADGIEFIRMENGAAVFRVGSGHYRFVSSP